ncbi:hypothetical protein BpHYR1_036601 [Brachionus plicatilis]|uniref:Uncharacterized protein n=1 Tax=Brachionus plicatilis TaxID=10195 RepID=A0A3M7T3Q7_BRAPC|nr:hypothetical protein BpHYR1_036601 [Brachionus plicatilis]
MINSSSTMFFKNLIFMHILSVGFFLMIEEHLNKDILSVIKKLGKNCIINNQKVFYLKNIFLCIFSEIFRK